ncbi:MAG: hypothetical protein Tsb0020_21120 [Haliangiales bacterium]
MSNYVERLQSSLDTVGTYAEFESLVASVFGSHPFAVDLDLRQLETLLPDYFGMSQGFRYVIAAAQKDVFFEAMRENRGVSKEMEMMHAVASFLVWDEAGGMELSKRGKESLPELLDLDGMHSELLRNDAEALFGHPVAPRFSDVTQRYLEALYRGLASTDVVTRCAHMVAFELHAGSMIDSLWGSISRVSTVSPDKLRYFALHVGGSDPAEVYHVQMTQELIERVVPAGQRDRFQADFLDAYRIHVDWCQALVDQSASLSRQFVA